MCFKKWCHKPDPIPVPDPATKRALLFAINDYPGSQNDLNGCVNDQKDVENKLNSLFPGFDIRRFKDSEVTGSRFLSEIKNAISVLRSGDILLIHYSGHGTQVQDPNGDETDGYDEAVYLYDGPVVDDDIGVTLDKIPDGAKVVLLFDSCFSGTITRAFNPGSIGTKNRFYQMPGVPIRRMSRSNFAISNNMKWIVISGCGEQQTCADAYFNGRANGAFTYYALKALKPNLTYAEWFTEIRKSLPSQEFDQSPTLEGIESLFTNIVFT
jgi:hypothetical protein